MWNVVLGLSSAGVRGRGSEGRMHWAREQEQVQAHRSGLLVVVGDM